jgi:hypothetical protein
MKKRVDALNRIVKLQARMHDLGRSRLTALEWRQASLASDLKIVFEMLESGDIAYGPQAKLPVRRIRSLQIRLDALASESNVARESAKAHGVRAKLAEKAAATAAKAYRDDKERNELAELIERALTRRDTSSG